MIKINENKSSVLIETINPSDNSIVVVKEYDVETKTLTGMIFEECKRNSAFETYNVVGEIVNDDIRLYDSDEEEEFDYEAYSGTSNSEDDY